MRAGLRRLELQRIREISLRLLQFPERERGYAGLQRRLRS